MNPENDEQKDPAETAAGESDPGTDEGASPSAKDERDRRADDADDSEETSSAGDSDDSNDDSDDGEDNDEIVAGPIRRDDDDDLDDSDDGEDDQDDDDDDEDEDEDDDDDEVAAAPRRRRERQPGMFADWRSYGGPVKIAILILLAFIGFTHFWNLGLKAVQHDESMFAHFSYLGYKEMEKNMPHVWDLANPMKWKAAGKGYEYQPILHGPVLEWGTALVWYFVYHFTPESWHTRTGWNPDAPESWYKHDGGDNEYTFRLFSSLLGILIMYLMFRLRNQWGHRVVWFAILFFATDPSILYFSRYIRTDLSVLSAYMMLIYTAVQYSRTLSWWRLILIQVLIWYTTCCKETYVIFFFLIGTWGFGCWLWGLIKGLPGAEVPFWRELKHAVLKQWYWLIIGHGLGALLSVTLMTSFFAFPDHWDGQLEAIEYWRGENAKHRIKGQFHFHLIHLSLYELPLMIFWVACLLRELWGGFGDRNLYMRRMVFMGWIGLSVIILHAPAWWTTNTDTDKVWNGRLPRAEQVINADGKAVMSDPLIDWDKRLHMEMGFHPWLFAQVLLVIMISGWINLNRKRPLLSFCNYWAGGSFLAYSYAGEKVPWVTIHITMPMCISAAIYVNDLMLKYFPSAAAMFTGARERLTAAGSDALERIDAIPATAPAAHHKKKNKNKKNKNRSQTQGGGGNRPDAGPKKPAAPPEQPRKTTIRKPDKPQKAARKAPPAAKSRPQPKPKRPARSPRKPRTQSRGGFLLMKTLLVIYFIGGMAWTLWYCMLMNFIQPDSPIERNTFACSHTQFIRATNFITQEAFDKYEGYDTEIHFQGEVSWPLHWTVRRFKMSASVPANTKARYIIVDNSVFDNMTSAPIYKDRYDWSVRRFRHYWVPTPIGWQAMKKVGLLLRSPEGMNEEERKGREACITEWRKVWNAVILRKEEIVRDDGPEPWRWLGGYDAYFGRLKDPAEARPAAAPEAAPAAAAPVTVESVPVMLAAPEEPAAP